MKCVYILAALFAFPAIAGAGVERQNFKQIDDWAFNAPAELSDSLAMGPNAGGMGNTDDSADATTSGNGSTDTANKETSGTSAGNTASPKNENTEATRVGDGEQQR